MNLVVTGALVTVHKMDYTVYKPVVYTTVIGLYKVTEAPRTNLLFDSMYCDAPLLS